MTPAMRVASRPKVETKEVCVPGSPLLQRGDPAPGFGRPANKRVLQSIMPKIFELVRAQSSPPTCAPCLAPQLYVAMAFNEDLTQCKDALLYPVSLLYPVDMCSLPSRPWRIQIYNRLRLTTYLPCQQGGLHPPNHVPASPAGALHPRGASPLGPRCR
eukprot:1159577-Pelagomonas_calceolata.AAC.3